MKRFFLGRWLDIQQIAVSGGHLDHSTDLETLREKGGYELTILLLNTAGKVIVPCFATKQVHVHFIRSDDISVLQVNSNRITSA